MRWLEGIVCFDSTQKIRLRILAVWFKRVWDIRVNAEGLFCDE